MFVKKSYNKGRMYLSLAQGYRKDGKVKQKTIEKLGYLNELEKIYDDPITHFKQLAKEHSLFPEEQRVIAVADRGLNSSDNTAFLSGMNDDDTRVYGQSVLGAD